MADQRHVMFAMLVMCFSMFLGDVLPKEFCQNEKFTAECASNEIIVITEAQYGRMNKSRCITKDYGFISCVSNVLDVADYYCSGRQECTIPVPSGLLDERKTCPKDLITYLHASYHCVKVLIAKLSCSNQKQIEIKAEAGLLASSVTNRTGCGSPLSPYIIRVGPGQRLNFTLHDYSYIGTAGGSGSTLYSHVTRSVAYAVIKDGNGGQSKRKTLYGTNKRTTHSYLSETNHVQVILFGTSTGRYFALEYQVIGCPDLVAPPQGWVRRSHNEALMGCDDSVNGHWGLVCVNTKWEVHNGKRLSCNATVTSAANQWESVVSLMSINSELALALIAGIAFVIAAIVILVGIVFIRRNYHRGSSTPTHITGTPWPRNPQSPQGPHAQGQGHQQEVAGKYSGSIRSQENEYASIQESMYGGGGGTNGRSKYMHINVCHQGEPVGGRVGGTALSGSPDLLPQHDSNKKAEAECVRHPEPKLHKYRVATAAVINNNNSKTTMVAGGGGGGVGGGGPQRQYFVLETGDPCEVPHDERAYSY